MHTRRLLSSLSLLLCLALAACSNSTTMPHAPPAPLSNVALLPPGSVALGGFYHDRFGRILLWRSGEWRSVDHGVLINPEQLSPTSLQLAAVQAAVSKARTATVMPECTVTPQSVARPMSCTGDDGGDGTPSYSDQYGNVYNDPSQPSGPLSSTSDGLYQDSNGTQWSYDTNSGQWLKVFATVSSTPSNLDAYVTAYNGINNMNTVMDWFLMLAVGPEQTASAAPEEVLAERFGVRGAEFEGARLLDQELVKIVADVGTKNVLNMTGREANSMLPKLNVPFATDVNAVQITTTADQAGLAPISWTS